MPKSETITLLFADLVDSTEHLQSVGDDADTFFRNYHRLVTEAIEVSGGQELQWLGDGVMASFTSSAEAVECATILQQTSRNLPGEVSAGLRVGIHVGEVLRRDDGYFGTPIVIARRLCDRADSGQILCSRTVADLLSARGSFEFRDLGNHALKGIAAPIGVFEVVYQRSDAVAMLNRTPFVGRARQMKWLSAKLQEVVGGRGGVVMLRGEAGIGKTRILEEFADVAKGAGVTVLRGACYDGEWQAPYGPFAEAIGQCVRSIDRAELVDALGKRAGVLARIAPVLHDLIEDISTPGEIAGENEHFRLFDSVAQFLTAIAQQKPLVLMLDYLHWADRGVTSMLSHVAHFAPKYPILLVGAYRDAEVNRQHPLSTALAAVSRLPGFESVSLQGLGQEDVAVLLGRIANRDAPDSVSTALGEATNGNPLFIREVLFHLFEEGKIPADGQNWTFALDLNQLNVPEGVRSVIGQRLARLSDETNILLTVAAAFNGPFSFEVAAATAVR